MKRVNEWFVLWALATGGATLSCHCKSDRDPKAAAAVKFAVARRGDLTVTVSATGTVEPEYTVEIKSKASGVVQAVHAAVGDRVEKGAPLVEIDPLTERRRLTQSEAELRMAQAQRASVATKLEYARTQLERDEKLLKKGLVSRERLDVLRKEIAVLNGDIKVAAAQILRARSSFQEAKDRLAETKIRAPIGGTVLERMVQPGQVIASATSATSGGTTLLKIADLQRLFVRAKIDEADVTKVRSAMEVEVTSDALPGKSFRGKVQRVAPQGVVESNVTVFDVMVELDDAGRRALRPMLTANIEIMVAETKGAVLLPRAAVRGRGRRAFVIVPKKGRHPVKIGLAGAKEVEILSGVSEGTRVLVSGSGSRRPGGTKRGERSATDPRSLRRMMGGGGRPR